MALFHLSVTQTKRSAGQSAIASAAYRAGERLYSEYYYDDYMSRLCTRTLYDKDGTPHVCVDTHMKRCLKIRLIWAVMRA